MIYINTIKICGEWEDSNAVLCTYVYNLDSPLLVPFKFHNKPIFRYEYYMDTLYCYTAEDPLYDLKVKYDDACYNFKAENSPYIKYILDSRERS